MKYSAIVIVGLVGLLLSSPAQAARQTEGLCASVLIPLMEQAGLSTDMYGTVLGCELESGKWVDRTVSQSQHGRWPEELDARGQSLMADVDDLSVDEIFAYSIRFDRNTSDIVTVGAGGKINRTDIADRLVSTGPNWLNNYRDAYSRNMETYLMNSAGQKPDLVEYLYWFMTKRDAVLQSMSYPQNPMAASAFLANWGYMQWPWPWQLADPIAIATFTEEHAQLTDNAQSQNGPSSTETVMGGVFVHICSEVWCEGVEGVVVNYATADGKHVGSCITVVIEFPNGTTGHCSFPVTIGVDYTVTLDVSSLPTGVSLSGSSTLTGNIPIDPDGPVYPPTFLVERV